MQYFFNWKEGNPAGRLTHYTMLYDTDYGHKSRADSTKPVFPVQNIQSILSL